MKAKTVQKILEKSKNDYDEIALSFDQTRRYLWPGLKNFIKYIKPGDKVLDLGCGNGKLRLLFKDVKVDYVGVDNSKELIRLGQFKTEFELEKQKFIVADVTQLPFPDNSFDIIFFIAVFHHIPSKSLRLQTLKEAKRVLRPGGMLIMANWNRWQKPYLHYIIKYTWLKIIGKSKLDFKDIYLPWMDGKVKRYFHAFTLGELKRLTVKSGLKVEDGFLSSWDSKERGRFNYLSASNIVIIAKKC